MWNLCLGNNRIFQGASFTRLSYACAFGSFTGPPLALAVWPCSLSITVTLPQGTSAIMASRHSTYFTVSVSVSVSTDVFFFRSRDQATHLYHCSIPFFYANDTVLFIISRVTLPFRVAFLFFVCLRVATKQLISQDKTPLLLFVYSGNKLNR